MDFALHRLVKQGVLRRLARGLYDYPRSHPQLGMLTPSVDTIAQALAGRDRLRIQPSGAYAANLLHLSEQVPAKAVFLPGWDNTWSCDKQTRFFVGTIIGSTVFRHTT